MKTVTNYSPMEEKLDDLKRIQALFEKINGHSPDSAWIKEVTEELFTHQPFFLTILMVYKFDLSTAEYEETLKLYMTIWEYFKVYPGSKTRVIPETRFEHFQDLNMEMLETREPSEKDTVTILQAMLFERFISQPVLLDLENQKKGALLVGIKSTIDCFEELINK